MCDLEVFTQNLFKQLTGTINNKTSIIRKHTKYLEKLGDVSLPLSLKNWANLVDQNQTSTSSENETIFDYSMGRKDINEQVNKLVAISQQWSTQIMKYIIVKNDIHLYISRPTVFRNCFNEVLNCGASYGSNSAKLEKIIHLDVDSENLPESSLTLLRLLILQKVTNNLLYFACDKKVQSDSKINMILSIRPKISSGILCGSIIDEDGRKNTRISVNELYEKRKTDMHLMAQHRYGVQVKPTPTWSNYFERMGRAAVTIEMLQNKSHKNIKIGLQTVALVNKSASFIFYNCARLAALFREFNSRVVEEIYPNLPKIDDVDFALLNQPEEWELVFVYILQFPLLIRDCINDVESGVINPHYLVAFLSNLSSVFSVYYRRIRILTKPRQHLFGVLFARIYLLKAVEQVFHIALNLLEIQPITEM